MANDKSARTAAILFTDIEDSARLTEEEPAKMRLLLARHDELARAVVKSQRGTLVQLTGDGLYALFDVPSDALLAATDLVRALQEAGATEGVQLSGNQAFTARVSGNIASALPSAPSEVSWTRTSRTSPVDVLSIFMTPCC